MAGELNTTKAILKVNFGSGFSSIAGQVEFTQSFNGAPIDVSNKSYADYTTYMNSELSSDSVTINGNIFYNSDDSYTQLREARLLGVSLNMSIIDIDTDKEMSNLYGIISSLTDAIPYGGGILSSISIIGNMQSRELRVSVNNAVLPDSGFNGRCSIAPEGEMYAAVSASRYLHRLELAGSTYTAVAGSTAIGGANAVADLIALGTNLVMAAGIDGEVYEWSGGGFTLVSTFTSDFTAARAIACKISGTQIVVVTFQAGVPSILLYDINIPSKSLDLVATFDVETRGYSAPLTSFTPTLVTTSVQANSFALVSTTAPDGGGGTQTETFFIQVVGNDLVDQGSVLGDLTDPVNLGDNIISTTLPAGGGQVRAYDVSAYTFNQVGADLIIAGGLEFVRDLDNGQGMAMLGDNAGTIIEFS